MDLALNKTPTDGVDLDKSTSKILILAFFGVVFIFIFSYFFNSFFDTQQKQSLIISIGGLTGFLVIFLFQSLFIKSLSRVNLIILAESMGLLGGFYKRAFLPLKEGNMDTVILIAIWIAFFILMWANYCGWRELKNILKIKFWRISKVVIPKAIAAIALFISILFIFPPSASTADSQTPFLKSLFEQIIIPASGVVQKIMPGFDLSLPIGKLTTKLAEEQINDMPEAKILPSSAKRLLINKTAKEFEGKIADIFGFPVNPELKTSDIVYQALIDKFNGFPEKTKNLILIGIVLALFFTIQGVVIPFRWLISVLAFVIYEILLAAGFATIMLEGKSREIIILK